MGRESLSLDNWNSPADKVMRSRRQPVSSDRFRVHSFVHDQGRSSLGPTALAAQSVLLVSASTTFQAPFALGVASAVR